MNMQAEPAYFDDVTEYTDAFPDGEYLLTLVRMENAEGGQYGPSHRWIFNVTNPATGVQVPAIDSSGGAYEWHQYASTKMTPRVKHFPWVTALLGRTPAVGESGAELARACIGKSMLAYCARPAGEPGARQKILSCKPVATGPTRPAQVSAPTPRYTAQGDPIGAVAADDDEEAELLAMLELARARKASANRAKAGVSDATYKELFPDGVEELPM